MGVLSAGGRAHGRGSRPPAVTEPESFAERRSGGAPGFPFGEPAPWRGRAALQRCLRLRFVGLRDSGGGCSFGAPDPRAGEALPHVMIGLSCGQSLSEGPRSLRVRRRRQLGLELGFDGACPWRPAPRRASAMAVMMAWPAAPMNVGRFSPPTPSTRRARCASPGSGGSRAGRAARRSAGWPSGSAHSWAWTRKVPKPPLLCSMSRSMSSMQVVGRADDAGPDAVRSGRPGRSGRALGHDRQRGHLAEVVEAVVEAVLDVRVRLLLGLGDVDLDRPGASRGGRRRCRTPPSAPPCTSQWWPSRSKPAVWVAPIDSSEQPNLPAARGPDGEIMRRDRDLGVRVGVRPEVQAGVAQREPVGLVGHRLVAAEQRAG